MSQPHGPCADFQLGLRIAAKSVININTAKSLQKSRTQFASRRNMSLTLDLGSYLDYISIVIHSFVDESEGAATVEDTSDSDELYALAVERGKAVESVAVKLDQIRQIGDRIAQHPGNFRQVFFNTI